MRNTTARPLPSETLVPAKTRLGISAGESPSSSTASATLRDGVDSPLRVDWFTCRSDEGNDACIGRDLVTLGQQHDVTGNQVFGKDFLLMPIADNRGVGRQHFFERLGGLAGTMFLPKAKDAG